MAGEMCLKWLLVAALLVATYASSADSASVGKSRRKGGLAGVAASGKAPSEASSTSSYGNTSASTAHDSSSAAANGPVTSKNAESGITFTEATEPPPDQNVSALTTSTSSARPSANASSSATSAKTSAPILRASPHTVEHVPETELAVGATSLPLQTTEELSSHPATDNMNIIVTADTVFDEAESYPTSEVDLSQDANSTVGELDATSEVPKEEASNSTTIENDLHVHVSPVSGSPASKSSITSKAGVSSVSESRPTSSGVLASSSLLPATDSVSTGSTAVQVITPASETERVATTVDTKLSSTAAISGHSSPLPLTVVPRSSSSRSSSIATSPGQEMSPMTSKKQTEMSTSTPASFSSTVTSAAGVTEQRGPTSQRSVSSLPDVGTTALAQPLSTTKSALVAYVTSANTAHSSSVLSHSSAGTKPLTKQETTTAAVSTPTARRFLSTVASPTTRTNSHTVKPTTPMPSSPVSPTSQTHETPSSNPSTAEAMVTTSIELPVTEPVSSVGVKEHISSSEVLETVSSSTEPPTERKHPVVTSTQPSIATSKVTKPTAVNSHTLSSTTAALLTSSQKQLPVSTGGEEHVNEVTTSSPVEQTISTVIPTSRSHPHLGETVTSGSSATPSTPQLASVTLMEPTLDTDSANFTVEVPRYTAAQLAITYIYCGLAIAVTIVSVSIYCWVKRPKKEPPVSEALLMSASRDELDDDDDDEVEVYSRRPLKSYPDWLSSRSRDKTSSSSKPSYSPLQLEEV